MRAKKLSSRKGLLHRESIPAQQGGFPFLKSVATLFFIHTRDTCKVNCKQQRLIRFTHPNYVIFCLYDKRLHRGLVKHSNNRINLVDENLPEKEDSIRC